MILSFYSSQDFTQKPIVTIPEIVTFSQSDPTGSFVNSNVDLSSLTPGSYYILIKSPEGSLQEILNNASPVSIASGHTISLNGTTPISLRMGDLNGDNTIDLYDYNIFVDCFSQKASSLVCKKHGIADSFVTNFADINDDGIVSGIDYNILIRNFSQTGF